MQGCGFDGQIDTSKFTKPMPWIGIYITVASFLCSLAMAVDTFNGFRRLKLWFPCNFFSLNSTTLTLLAIATKITVDLNTSMPSSQDQLIKLTGTIFICVAMGNFIPSLGTMGTTDLYMNIIALSILVVTIVINMCIQISTGVIYVFIPEHIAVMVSMIVLIAVISCSALAIPTTKNLLEKKYQWKHGKLCDGKGPCILIRAEEEAQKFWIMAHTGSPQFVTGRSVTCSSSSFISLLTATVLVEAIVRSYIMKSLSFCQGVSDYKWSSMFILVSQVFAVAIGVIAPACRWFNAINYRNPKTGNWRFKVKFVIEKYWIQSYIDLKERRLPLHISNRRMRKMIHQVKNLILDIIIGIQSTVIFASKLVQYISLLPATCLRKIFYILRSIASIHSKFYRSISNDSSDFNSVRVDLNQYVLHLEGEENLVDLILRCTRKDVKKWIHQGKNKQPENLIRMLNKYASSQRSINVNDYAKLASSIGSEEFLPQCWSLPVVTLASIAVAISSNTQDEIDNLLISVDEGMKYVRFIEKNLGNQNLINAWEAAEIVWVGLDIYNQWLKVDLKKLAHEEKNAAQIMKKIAEIGKNSVIEYNNMMDSGGCRKKNSSEWPVKVLAANYMFRITTYILQNLGNYRTDEQLFDWLERVIADTFCDCFTNLLHAISEEMICSKIEARVRSVREAACLLGQGEYLLKLGHKRKQETDPEMMENMEKWPTKHENIMD